MKTTHTIVAEYDDGQEIEITFTMREGRKAVRTLRNGDPGYPADPDEIEFQSARIWNGRACTPAEEVWAMQHLEEREDDALEVAWSDRFAEEDAEEERRNNGRFGVGA